MRRPFLLMPFVAWVACCAKVAPQAGQSTPAAPAASLEWRQTIPLPKVEGRIDHLAFGAGHRRLFVAALGNGSLEAVDMEKGVRTDSASGFGGPQGVAFAAQTGQVLAACGGDGSVRVLDAVTLAQKQRIDLGGDADNVRLLADGKTLLVGCKDGALAVLDADDKGAWRKSAEVALARHPEGFEAEPGGDRVFVNIPRLMGDGEIAVVDRRAGKVAATWRIADAGRNFPLAFDASRHVLYAGCRSPACVAVLDAATGKTLAKVPCVADADDLFVDAAARRLYVVGGGGRVEVFALGEAGVPTLAGQTPTASGTRTGLWDEAGRRLLVAVPRQGGQEAQIRVYAAPK